MEYHNKNPLKSIFQFLQKQLFSPVTTTNFDFGTTIELSKRNNLKLMAYENFIY